MQFYLTVVIGINKVEVKSETSTGPYPTEAEAMGDAVLHYKKEFPNHSLLNTYIYDLTDQVRQFAKEHPEP